MYEYSNGRRGMGQITPANARVFGSGVGRSCAARGRAAPAIIPANVGIMGSGIGVSAAIPPRPIYGISPIENCAMGRCGSSHLGTAEQNVAYDRPTWHYVALGLGIGAGLYFLNKRAAMRRNPEENLTPAEVTKQAAAISIQAGIPSILWGPPGIGKTQWVIGLGKAMAPMNKGESVEVFTVIGSTKDPTDIGGMPTVEGGLRPPSWAAALRERSLRGLRSILFLDEFSSMSPMVHAALLRVVNEKIAGDTNFDPKNGPLKGRAVHIIAAANRPKHGAASRDLPPPAANRMIHFNWPAPTAAEWAEGMLFGWKSPFYFQLPEDWRRSGSLREARETVGAFLKFRESKASPVLFAMPELKATDDEGNRATGGAWPSPRSWELAADVWAATMASGAPKNVQIEAIRGAVGAVSGELFNFAKYQDLPNPEDILKSPESWAVPTDTTKLFIISNALVNALRNKVTEKRYENTWRAIIHAIDVTDEPALAIAARELAAMKKDRRYEEDLKGFNAAKIIGKKFVEMQKKMKLL